MYRKIFQAPKLLVPHFAAQYFIFLVVQAVSAFVVEYRVIVNMKLNQLNGSMCFIPFFYYSGVKDMPKQNWYIRLEYMVWYVCTAVA